MIYFKKKHQSLFLITTLGISLLAMSAMEENSASAASSYKTTSVSLFKTVKKPTYIYMQAKSTAKKAEKLEKDMGVVTTGKKKNGYSQIRYAFSYAYVKTSTLAAVKANTSAKKYAWAINKKYTFKIPGYTGPNAVFTPKFHKNYPSISAVKNFWMFSFGESLVTATEYETTKGLYEGAGEGGASVLVLKYPIKKNSVWKTNGITRKIVATNVTVKTNAGTFKNVVKVKTGNSISYYAPNKGLIKTASKSNAKKYSTSLILSK